MKLLDWIIFLIVLFSLSFLLIYYYVHSTNQCISNPLSYGAKQISKQYGINFEGIGYLNGLFKENYFYFNSTGIYPIKS